MPSFGEKLKLEFVICKILEGSRRRNMLFGVYHVPVEPF